MLEEMVDKVFKILKKFGVFLVYIGGGEFFLNFEGLKKVINKVNENGIYIEYIEINVLWVENEDEVKRRLKELKNFGIEIIFVLISFFYNEYILFKKVLRLIQFLNEVGIGIFFWIEGFVNEIRRLNIDKIYFFFEYKDLFGENYIRYFF